MPTRIFLLSPARLDGARARVLLNPDAAFPLARALGTRDGAALSDVFSFLSGLYFRGKHAYAQMFGRPSASVAAVHLITTTRGLLPPETRVTRRELEAFAEIDLSAGDDRFHAPLLRDASRIRGGAARQHRDREVCRPAPNGVRTATTLSRDVRRPRRHEPRRHPVAEDACRGRADVHPGVGRGPTRPPSAKAGASAVMAGQPPAVDIPAQGDAERRIAGRSVALTNLDKVFWPGERLTKGDVLRYYAAVAPVLLPHLFDRAMVMKRYPNGITGKSFFMKRAPSPRPEWIETCTIEHRSGNVIDFPMVQDLASLLWIVNLGCIDLNPWYA